MKLLIVLVNYHGAALTIDCLGSLRSELNALPQARVALCENGSGPAEADRLRAAIRELELGDRVTLTEVFPNRGFTGGNNAVIAPELASADPPDAVMLLNNDTLVREGAVREIVEFMTRRPDVGLCGSRLEYPDGQSQLAARRTLSIISEFESQVRLAAVSWLLKKWVITPPEQQTPHPCDWAPGAALTIRREVLEAVGLLDEGLYTYFDDVDYCHRASRAGWPTWYVPASRIVHLVGQTTGITAEIPKPKRRADYWFLARRRFFLKNFGPAYAALADAAAIAGLFAWNVRTRLQRKANPDPPCLLRDYVRHSVFVTGFRLRAVPNPALSPAS
jgi:GT2 family glycosyltransferase